MNRKIKLTENELTDLVHRILESKNKHVTCERCDWDWDITAEDEDPYLCHMCGHRNDKKENKEGAGPYDAPAFEMEPDHTTFKHEYTEQDDEEPQYVSIDFSDEPFEKLLQSKTLKGPYKIIHEKLSGKEFRAVSDNLDITYKFVGVSPGEKYNWFFYKPKQGEEFVSALVHIEKVLYKGQDVTEIVKLITNRGGQVRSIVKGNAYDRLNQLSKNLGLLVGQIATNI